MSINPNFKTLDMRGTSIFTDGNDVKVKFPDGTSLSFREMLAHINQLEARLSQVETCYIEDKLMGKEKSED